MGVSNAEWQTASIAGAPEAGRQLRCEPVHGAARVPQPRVLGQSNEERPVAVRIRWTSNPLDTTQDSPWGKGAVRGVCEELVGLYGAPLLGVASAEELAGIVLRVASSTGKNKNSMLQDVLAKR